MHYFLLNRPRNSFLRAFSMENFMASALWILQFPLHNVDPSAAMCFLSQNFLWWKLISVSVSISCTPEWKKARRSSFFTWNPFLFIPKFGYSTHGTNLWNVKKEKVICRKLKGTTDFLFQGLIQFRWTLFSSGESLVKWTRQSQPVTYLFSMFFSMAARMTMIWDRKAA